MGILFDGKTDPTTLAEVVYQAVGAGSVCWEHMEGTGIFESDRAAIIAAEVVGWVERNYLPRQTLTVDLDPGTPLLGLATSAELINELQVRADIHGWGLYRTVDGE